MSSRHPSVTAERPPAPGSRPVLRMIAAFKLLKAAAMIAGGVAALNLLSPGRAASVQAWLERLALDQSHQLVAMVAGRALELLDLAGTAKIGHLAVVAFLFATIYLVQGVGLVMARRWAEYLTVGVTMSFLPVEVVSSWHRWTALRAGTIALNLAVVAYLFAQLASQEGEGARDREASPDS